MSKEISKQISVLELFQKLFHNFNARQMKDATVAFKKHLDAGGKMLVAMGGAMSSAQLGVTLAPMIKEGKVHAISCTGANLEESVFRLVAHNSYKDYPNYRYFTKEDDEAILNRGERRVTDTSIPEEETFRVVEPIILKYWKEAEKNGERFFPHEYFYKILLLDELKDKYEGNPEHCWLLEAAKKNLPIVVPGWEDSTLGNIFAGYCKVGEASPMIMKTGVEYMMYLYDQYQELSLSHSPTGEAKDGPGLGFFQIGGGISGDFPICVVPSIKYDLKKPVRPWGYFCQISDSTTSYGSYSGATPNEKITWDKLTKDTPMFVIESDATIVAPLIFEAILNRYIITEK
ncbi:deoxyhypusine synthase [Candidatus Nomurabacteria bacterium RIFCSPHIGHO2_02_FULL_37_13]|uniref:Deoxyhypusine synthase n=1 Tax=Candidatus Nomurabacteria bacterium RIFCSPHIGHO2_02_FULL_37_13 TaxID=1801750 RepID=A0A1F6W576_9BACT|nr:MAG: deoxyhypusine synthase [Candidatus Nomurabacteria bacterium RIFCSPHIGHO2_01_FULL_36_23]OGI76916.1 MAG: deoxyhypusine synthase [Candidatus Nomurabacteria bacterium RIFCSPHIGHO2_02_FULL_37_13]OGI87441.1 MAG: deoxyhypusine synthase [Candidatus Nomurabacteria bacterium RIFCSPLOWO2_01_FULL_37_25]